MFLYENTFFRRFPHFVWFNNKLFEYVFLILVRLCSVRRVKTIWASPISTKYTTVVLLTLYTTYLRRKTIIIWTTFLRYFYVGVKESLELFCCILKIRLIFIGIFLMTFSKNNSCLGVFTMRTEVWKEETEVIDLQIYMTEHTVGLLLEAGQFETLHYNYKIQIGQL